MNDKEICKKCIYYDDFCCRNYKAICVNNSEYRDAETVINYLINQLTREGIELKHELLRLREEQKSNLLWTRILIAISAGLLVILLILKFI